MKSGRQNAILDIVENEDIETQEELAAALSYRGFQVTQATVSRDIKDLRLLKVLAENGRYKYATADQAESRMSERYIRVLGESVLSVAFSGNLIVIKTLSGSANVAAEALDSFHWPELLGSLAGDNTIFLAIDKPEDVETVCERIKGLMR